MFIWKDQERLVFSAILGVALWIVNFLQAHTLAPFNPLLPAILAGFTTPFFLALSFLVTRRKFAITASYLTFAGMASFNLVMGPPGVHKLLLALLAGGAYDAALCVSGTKRNWPLLPAFVVYTAVSVVTYVGAFLLLDLPGKDKVIATLYGFAAFFLLSGLASTAFAIWFYKKRLLGLAKVRAWSEL